MSPLALVVVGSARPVVALVRGWGLRGHVGIIVSGHCSEWAS